MSGIDFDRLRDINDAVREELNHPIKWDHETEIEDEEE